MVMSSWRINNRITPEWIEEGEKDIPKRERERERRKGERPIY